MKKRNHPSLFCDLFDCKEILTLEEGNYREYTCVRCGGKAAFTSFEFPPIVLSTSNDNVNNPPSQTPSI